MKFVWERKIGAQMAERDVVWCAHSDEASTFRLRSLSFVFVVFRPGTIWLSIYFFHSLQLEFTKSLTFCWSWSICLVSACLQRSAVKVKHPFANKNCSSNGTNLWTRLWINSWKKRCYHLSCGLGLHPQLPFAAWNNERFPSSLLTVLQKKKNLEFESCNSGSLQFV